MGEVLKTGQRSVRVTMAIEETTGREMPAIVAMRERPGLPDDEVLLGLDESVFMLWCSQMTHDEVAGVSASSVLMQMANESADKRVAYHAARAEKVAP